MAKDENELENEFDDMEDITELRDSIFITDEDGNKVELFVVDAITDNGANYFLCIENDGSDDDDEEAEIEAFLFKEVDIDEDSSFFQPVEDEEEYDRIISLFQSEDYDLSE